MGKKNKRSDQKKAEVTTPKRSRDSGADEVSENATDACRSNFVVLVL